MQALIILAHPEPESFNSQLKDMAATTREEAGYRVEVSDLYAIRFDPVEGPQHFREPRQPDWFSAQTEQRHAWENGTTSADTRAEVDKLEHADFVLFQYPMWWYTMPAILKGWLDWVLVYGGLYTSRMRYDAGYFSGRRAIVSVTTGGPEATFAFNGRNGDIDHLLWAMNFTSITWATACCRASSPTASRAASGIRIRTRYRRGCRVTRTPWAGGSAGSSRACRSSSTAGKIGTKAGA